MGLSIDKAEFSAAEHAAFARRLEEDLAALRQLLSRPGFGAGPTTIGAELELNLVSPDGRPLPLNRKVFRTAADPRLQLELDRFNLEYNLDAVPAAGEPFGHLERQMTAAIARIDEVAGTAGGRIACIGILPTLRETDLQAAAITRLPRYRALAAALRKLRGAPFVVEINGIETLSTTCESVALEGANTSHQLHLRVDPERFADSFNAAQLLTPLAVAAASNSPVLLGRVLWDETRIALFKQAIDHRAPDRTQWRQAARAPFGHGWVRRGALELFAEAVALFPPLLPVLSSEDPVPAATAGAPPALAELRLHQSTIWQWNRAIYDPADGGHLRIEFRALPAGPTPVDMAANAAFLIGLVLGCRDRMEDLIPRLPFHYAEHNFYRAAHVGLDAELLWPAPRPVSPAPRSVRDLIEELLPAAAAGLVSAGVNTTEAAHYLGVIRRRVQSGRTGARWQRARLRHHESAHGREEALRRMLADYLEHAATGRPVAEWPD